jgi:hypothetical protein
MSKGIRESRLECPKRGARFCCCYQLVAGEYNGVINEEMIPQTGIELMSIDFFY